MPSRIGKPQVKVEAGDVVSGRIKYIDDLWTLSGTLSGYIIRSPLPHARITSIDTSKAESLPGVRAIITPFNTPQAKLGVIILDEPVLASQPRYIGDEVAAIAAVDETTAKLAAQYIEIKYETLPANFDLPAPGDVEAKSARVAYSPEVKTGDSENALASSPVRVRLDCQTSTQVHAALETMACLAKWSPSEGLVITAPLQDPANTRGHLSRVLGLPESKIRVIQTPIAGSYGSKLFHRRITYICALLAMRSKQPVYIRTSMEEEFIAGRPRVPAKIRMELGADLDGTIRVHKSRISADNGAYCSFAPGLINVMACRFNALYRTAVIDSKVDLIYTNKVPTGGMRGFGNITMMFALETAVDALARKLSIHPIELRKRNIYQEGERSSLGWKINSSGLLGCLETIELDARAWVEEGKYRSHGNKRIGVGFACGVHVSSNRTSEFDGAVAIAKLNDDGTVFILTGDPEVGQGIRTTQAIIAAEALGIDVSSVTVAPVDTTYSPYGLGVFADRGTTISGMAVLLAAQELKGKILATAGEMLATSELELADGVVAGKQGKRLTLGEIAKYSLWRRNGKPLSSEVAYDPDTIRLDSKVSFIGNPSTGYTFCAQAAQVEVDMGTGQVKVLRIASAHDSGRIINPLLAEGQVQGAIIQGLGFALSERLILEDGEVKNPNLRDYKIPTFLDLPEIKVHFVEACEETGPFGAKGIGQTGIITTAPTIANAVSDAIQARITQLPMTPESVWRAISLHETLGGNYGAK